ncbi:MAG: peptidyl-alpha-hydroxyglycine alpha-amidating lyase family protein [Bauldia sp.]
MKRYLVPLAMLAAMPSALAQAPGQAPTTSPTVLPVPTQKVPEIPFDSVPNFLRMPPNLYLGEAAGVAVNSKGHIFVYSRGDTDGPAYAARASQLLEFTADGQFIREIGHNLYAWAFAHTVRIDKDDNIWATDKGTDMIVQFNPDGQVMKVFGRKKEASDANAVPWERPNPPLPPIDQQFRQPTDVTWDPAGNIYISDGYINARVAVFDKDGFWVRSFGTPGAGPGQLNTPHSIASDKDGNIYVADRGNRRVQVFDGTGKVLRQIVMDVYYDYDKSHAPLGAKAPMTPQGVNFGTGLTQAPGAPWAICITPPNASGQQFLYAADAFPGRIYKVTLDGTVVGVLGEAGKALKQFGWIHEIACPSENELFVAEILNWRIQKLTLRPQQQRAGLQ